jgi:hypothetical protein
MSERIVRQCTMVVTIAVCALASSMATAQGSQAFIADSVCPDNAPVVFHACALDAAHDFEPPRMPNGRPDFNGTWVLPGGQIGGAYEDLEEHPRTLDDLGGPTAIVDPPDGKLPIRAWADQRRRDHPQTYFHHNAACLQSGVPNSMYLGGTRQFLQTPEQLAILTYNAHGFRVIALDETSRPSDRLRLWNGISNGRWDGNTLVIETANLNGIPWLDQRGRFVTEDIHVVERLTLVDPNTLHYTATIEDANVFTQPFTIALAYRRSTADRYEMQELACYENNEALMSISRAAGMRMFTGISPEEAHAAEEASQ